MKTYSALAVWLVIQISIHWVKENNACRKHRPDYSVVQEMYTFIYAK